MEIKAWWHDDAMCVFLGSSVGICCFLILMNAFYLFELISINYLFVSSKWVHPKTLDFADIKLLSTHANVGQFHFLQMFVKVFETLFKSFIDGTLFQINNFDEIV